MEEEKWPILGRVRLFVPFAFLNGIKAPMHGTKACPDSGVLGFAVRFSSARSCNWRTSFLAASSELNISTHSHNPSQQSRRDKGGQSTAENISSFKTVRDNAQH